MILDIQLMKYFIFIFFMSITSLLIGGTKTIQISSSKTGYVTSTNWELISTDLQVGYDDNPVVNDVAHRAFTWFDIPSEVQNSTITSASITFQVKDISQWNNLLISVDLYSLGTLKWDDFHNSKFGYGTDDGHWSMLGNGASFESGVQKNATKIFYVYVSHLQGKNQIGFSFIANPEIPNGTSGNQTNKIILNNPILNITYNTPELDVSPVNIVIDAPSGSYSSFNISSNLSWHIVNDASWLGISQSNGSNNSTIKVAANTSNTSVNPRSTILTITGGSINKYVNVTQQGASLPSKPNNPNPANGATLVSTTASLSWSNGGGATGYKIYFGTNQSSLNYLGWQASNSITPGNLQNNNKYYWRIDAVNDIGTTTGDIWQFTTGSVSSLPSKPVNPSPVNGVQSVVTNPTLSWSNGGGATSYDIYFGTDPSSLSNSYVGSQNGNSWGPLGLPNSTTFYWRIDAVNSTGKTIGDVWQFTTGSVSSLPSKPVNPSPVNGAQSVLTNPILSWSNGGGATSYNIYFGTDPSSLNLGYVGSQNGNSWGPLGLPNGITFYWRIDAVNSTGTTIGDVWQFTTESATSLPSKPFKPDPANGAISVASNLTLSWSNGGGATSYKIYFGTDSSSLNNSYVGSQNGNSWGPLGLPRGITFYWRIDAVNSAGTTSGDIWHFTTASTPQTLESPSPISPSNGDTVTINPTLVWNSSNGATSYELQVSSDPNFNGYLSGTDNLNSTSYTFNNLGTNHYALFYWRVRAKNAQATSGWSDVWNFTTISVPFKAKNPQPSNGAINQSTITNLGWTNGSYATSYNVYFGSDQNNITFEGNVTSTTYNPGVLNYNTTYYWRIDAVNTVGTTTGDIWNFRIENSPTGVENISNKIPTDYFLYQNYPNPFNPTTTISYSVPQTSFVNLKIYDVLGNEMFTLVNGERQTGNYKVNFNASNIPSGVYFYRMQAGNFVSTKKFVLFK